jgi:HAD superfamily hydrolase (TIGR01509 family)
MIKAIVFDLDGVLLDSEPVREEVRRQVVAETGGHWNHDTQSRLMGMSTAEWANFLGTNLGVRLPPELIAHTVIERMAARYHDHLPLMHEAAQAVRRLARRWPLGLASSSPLALIERVLSGPDFGPHFTVAMSTDQVAHGKPAPDIYIAVMMRLGVTPSQCAAVEDSTNGLASAARAGLHVIAIPNPRYPPDPEAVHAATLVVPDLSGLTPELVGSLS